MCRFRLALISFSVFVGKFIKLNVMERTQLATKHFRAFSGAEGMQIKPVSVTILCLHIYFYTGVLNQAIFPFLWFSQSRFDSQTLETLTLAYPTQGFLRGEGGCVGMHIPKGVFKKKRFSFKRLCRRHMWIW